MPNWNCAVKMLIKGFPTQPFSMATLPPFGEPNKQLIDALKQLSAAKYARPRSIVGSEITERLFTKTAPMQGSPDGGPQFDESRLSPNSQLAQRQMPTKSSFLDEWLAKRKMRDESTKGSPPKTSFSNSTPSEPSAPLEQDSPEATESMPVDTS
ncbi:hypothetical protein, partial [Aquidulcibacter sp.]|uniref:hypothetical protein n=1 Tax=Aquidulcibacter sp. TaxID=2052990 RepID=UPI0028A8A19B